MQREGSGKTSLLNLVEHELHSSSDDDREIPVYRFNPWWFSDADHLLVTFLHRFSQVIGKSIEGKASNKIGRFLSTFASLLKPMKYIPGLNLPVEALSDLAAASGEAMKKAGELASQNVSDIRRSIDELLLKWHFFTMCLNADS